MEHRKNTNRGKRWMLFLVLAAAALLLVSLGMTYWIGLAAVKANRRVSQERAVLRQLEQVASTLKDAETGQRGFLLTGQEQYLEPYEKALATLENQLRGLEQLAAGGQLPPRQVQALLDLVQKKLAELKETVRTQQERGGEAAMAIVRTGEGRRHMDAIRSELARIEDQQEADDRAAAVQARHADLRRSLAFLLAGLVNLAFLGWAYARLSEEMRYREAAVEETQTQKEFLSTTLTSIGDGVIVTNAHGRVTFLNPEAERLTGWTQETAAGFLLSEVFRIVNERTRLPVENPVQKVLDSGAVVGLANHTVLLSKDGREVPIDDSGAPVRRGDGPLQGVVLVFRDISQQRRAQQATERLATIVESSEDAILSLSLDALIQTWNAGAERLFGYRAEEVIGKSVTLLLPPERVNEETQLLDRLQRGERVHHYETVRVTKAGQRLDVSLTLSALKDSDGKVIGVSKILRDITLRKRAEGLLTRHKEELERMVAERTASLEETTGELNSFVYTVAHDLRAPLRAQHGFAKALLEDVGEALGETGRGYVERISVAAGRLDALVSDLLSYASVSRQRPALVAVDLQHVAKQIHEDLADALRRPGVAVCMDELRGQVLAHEGSLLLILDNLVSNAVKFVRSGAPTRVRLWSEPRNGWVRLWVEDNGIGIAPELQRKLFGVFQRLHTADEYPGTGIGLALVKKGAERMGGTVGVDSAAGQGSRFWVDLRAATGPRA